MELEERKKKADQEAKLLALSKPDLIKVVTEVATKAGVDPKALQSSKGGKSSYRNRMPSRKRKAQELEPEVRILGLKCNRSLPEGVHSVNNMVIEHSEQGIFFIDVFGNEAFQRISDIHKVDVNTLLSYLAMALNINTPANQRFCAIIRIMIESHPDKKKLKLKRVKLEAIGYSLN
ncbi:hypothetical protein Tco_1067753 [Tanacetum coccineum]|uniref:Uncharacterized protein n=1 Tax=Tanacetum coccineum TaxID=301880 RepID=A0ABQ5HF73_9ASTR